MRLWNLFSSAASAGPVDGQPIVQTMVRRPLHRVLAFTRRSIHDVVNDPLAKSEVLCYYKLHKQVERSMEVTELERQWNSLGR